VAAPVEAPAAVSGKRLDVSARAAAVSLLSSPKIAAPATKHAAWELSGAPTVAASTFQLDLACDARSSCKYRGKYLDATIDAQGDVSFASRGPKKELLLGGAADRMQVAVRLAPGAFDVERVWFLEATHQLRAERAAEAHAVVVAAERRALKVLLTKLCADDLQQALVRRKRLFDLWDATSTDEIGAAHRAIIIDFIHARASDDVELQYTAAELAQLNGSRHQRDVFSP
jgi:hypothetical protein